MTSNEVRDKFLTFFEGKGHTRVPSSSLVPTDPSVLFTTAGMQQFKPYYLGEKSPWGDKVCSVQKCVRTSDIDSVGDDTHLTFFEMLGNFAFNNAVSKREAITWAYEFITKELGLSISHIAVFAGNADIPADSESEEIWKSLDVNLEIRKTGADETFWGPTGDEGPCGPTTEIYVNEVEIWNIVFNEYYKNKDGQFKKLENFGIDTGMGLERLLVQVQGKKSVYETDVFEPITKTLPDNLQDKDKKIIANHVKTIAFMFAEGIKPQSSDKRGAVMHRLMNDIFINKYSEVDFELPLKAISKIYPEYKLDSNATSLEFKVEKEIYNSNIDKAKKGLLSQKKIGAFDNTPLTGHVAFGMSSTLGTRVSDILQIAKELEIDKTETFEEELNDAFKKHQQMSRTASAGMFKGGLSDPNDPMVVKLHTAHHLLLAALQEVLGKDVKQRGSNITPERLRMDFAFDRKVTAEELAQVEKIVNEKIAAGLPVIRKEMPRIEAEKLGAQMEFGVKYPDMVSVYFVGDETAPFSIEFCGGPHVSNTSELGHFTILKEEASSAGVRRIKAVVL